MLPGLFRFGRIVSLVLAAGCGAVVAPLPPPESGGAESLEPISTGVAPVASAPHEVPESPASVALRRQLDEVMKGCAWDDTSGYDTQIGGACPAGYAWFGQKAFPGELREELLASEDPRRRFLGVRANRGEGMTVDAALGALEKETSAAVATALAQRVEDGPISEAIAGRVAARIVAPGATHVARRALLSAPFPEESPGRPIASYREAVAALLHGADLDAQRAAAVHLSCAEAASYLPAPDDLTAGSVVAGILQNEGGPGCENRDLVSAAVAETKKRGAVRMIQVGRYLGLSVFLCHAANREGTIAPSAATTISLGGWFRGELLKERARTKAGAKAAAQPRLLDGEALPVIAAIEGAIKSCKGPAGEASAKGVSPSPAASTHRRAPAR